MRDLILSVNHISKAFFSQQAVKDVSFDVYEGEIIGLLGANGAGKSTLLKIIGGTLSADEGTIVLNGKRIEKNNPHLALKMGIVSVYQELNLFPDLTVSENLFLGNEIKTNIGTINWKETNRRAQQIMDEYGLDIKVDTVVSNLSVAQQHMVEIARAFNENPLILLLDEPTSALSEKEKDWLFTKMKAVAKSGTTIIYVSHRLDEVIEICERNVILRDGSLVYSSTGPMEKSSIIKYIVGHDVILKKILSGKNKNEIIYECKYLKSKNGVSVDHLYLRKGEILGLAGLVGAGRTEVLHTLFGIDQKQAGDVIKNGREIKINSPADAIHEGIMLIPEDRKTSGLFMGESGRFNIAAATLDLRTKLGLVDLNQEKQSIEISASQVILDNRRLDHFVQQLSGGNQQKVVLAKTLLANADVYLLDEPTRGVDIGAREEIYSIIKGLAAQGKSILLVSSDWEELIYLSDRIQVISEMQSLGEVEGEVTESAIIQIASKQIAYQEDIVQQEVSILKRFYAKLAINRSNNFAQLFVILIALLVIGAVINPFFGSWMNLGNLFGQSMPLLILSLGQLIVIIAGGIDISSGALMAASSIIGLTLMTKFGVHPAVGVTIIFALAVLVGSTNAFLILKAKVDPFVVTIGMMLILEGVALIVSPKPIGPAPEIFKVLFNREILGVPSALILLILLILIFTYLLRFIPLGRRFFAIGGSKPNSFNAGVNVTQTVFLSYIFCSLMSSLAAIYILGRFGAADPVLGPGMELEAIASVLIGGATLAGGRGSLAGTICGVFVLGVLENLLSLMDINVWYQDVISGLMLLIIIASYGSMVKNKAKG